MLDYIKQGVRSTGAAGVRSRGAASAGAHPEILASTQ